MFRVALLAALPRAQRGGGRPGSVLEEVRVRFPGNGLEPLPSSWGAHWAFDPDLPRLRAGTQAFGLGLGQERGWALVLVRTQAYGMGFGVRDAVTRARASLSFGGPSSRPAVSTSPGGVRPVVLDLWWERSSQCFGPAALGIHIPPPSTDRGRYFRAMFMTLISDDGSLSDFQT